MNLNVQLFTTHTIRINDILIMEIIINTTCIDWSTVYAKKITCSIIINLFHSM